MIRGLIFDLDQTLVDSSIALEARHRRDWREAYSLIPQFKVYDGVKEALNIARSRGLKIAIVSSAPRSYVLKVLGYYNIPADVIVGYHDASRPKPSPEPMTEALRQLGLTSSETMSFGDKSCDLISSSRAGIPFISCLWDLQAYNDRATMRNCYMTLYKSADIVACISMI